MISSDRNDNIQRLQTEIAINRRFFSDIRGGRGRTEFDLPFDRNNPPDGDTDNRDIAPNYIDNSDFDFSKDAYINNPAVGGNDAQEAFNWYRQLFVKLTDITATNGSTTVNSASSPFLASHSYPLDFVLLDASADGQALSGTLTRVSDSQATLSVPAQVSLTNAVMWFGDSLAETSANALKASGHTTFPANEGANALIPRWEQSRGWVEVGSKSVTTYDIACPLPLNLVRAGLKFHFRCIVATRDGATTGQPIRLSAGVWDDSPTQQRFLEGGNFTLNANTVGATGTTTYRYKVIADLDDGSQIESDTVTVTNGNAVLSTSNYNRLTWINTVGILNFRIYREVGGVIKRVFTIRNGNVDYNDYGTDETETLTTFPTVAGRRPLVYKESPEFNPVSSTSWVTVTLTLEVPRTYDASNTTGKQWLRVGVVGNTADVRLLTIDRIMFSLGDGGWNRSARDLNRIANQNPTSNPIDSTQGDSGIGNCFTLDTPIVICDKNGKNAKTTTFADLDKGVYVDSGNRFPNKITNIRDGSVPYVISVQLSNRILFTCSPSERLITSRADKNGTRIDALTFGDEILCKIDGRVESATIEGYDIIHKETKVRTISLTKGKTFVAGYCKQVGGAICHNLKPVDLEIDGEF